MDNTTKNEDEKSTELIEEAEAKFEEVFLTLPLGIRAVAERFVKKFEKFFMIITLAGLAYVATIETISYQHKLVILAVYLLSMLLNGAQRYEDGKVLKLWEVGATNSLATAYERYKKARIEEITNSQVYTRSRCLTAFIYVFLAASILSIFSWPLALIAIPILWNVTVKLLHKHDTSIAIENLTGKKPKKI